MIERLPALREATQVLFVGHSGGAHGLYHNIDHLAAQLPHADVRALFDANFLPSVENEAAFGRTPGGAPLGGHVYTGQWAGVTTGDGATFAYKGRTFNTRGLLAEQGRSWRVVYDSSCLAAHPGPGRWRCADRMHVLFNHVATPFAFHEDFLDPNPEHTNGHTGHQVQGGTPGSYSYCPTATTPCLPRFSMLEHRARLMEQATRLMSDSDTLSELATGADASLGGDFPTAFAWMPACSTHERAYSNASFFRTELSYLGNARSMRRWLEGFMRAPPRNVVAWRIHGYRDASGNVMATTRCR